MELEDKIERMLSLLKKRKVDEFEIFVSATDFINAESKAKSLNSLSRSRESGIGLRVVRGGAFGFAYGDEPDDNLVESALASAKGQFTDPYNVIPGPCDEYTDVNAYDENVEAVDAEYCIERAIELETSAFETDPRVNKVRKASFSRAHKVIRIVNSKGIDASSKTTLLRASIMVTAAEDSDVQAGFDFDQSHFIDGLDVREVGRRAANMAVGMLGAKHINTTRMPALFDRDSAAEFLSYMAGSFSGEAVAKGKSYLADKLGKRIFSPGIVIVDDPTVTGASDASSFDGEGVPSRRNVLVEDGVLKGFVYNTYWGMFSGKESTGNSVRSNYRDMPLLGVRHLCLKPSGDGLEEILQGLKTAFKITDIMGMHTADSITGEFSVGVNGFILERGEAIYPVREAAISGNIYDMLSRVLAVGNDSREFGSVSTPSFVVDTVDISGK